MDNPRPRAQRPPLKSRCTLGEDPGTRGNEIGLSWNKPISPTIRGRMKKDEYSRMSRGGTGGMPISSIVQLTGRGSTSTKLGGSHLSPRKGFGLVMSSKSRGTGERPTGPH
jgi:hypothetical protein